MKNSAEVRLHNLGETSEGAIHHRMNVFGAKALTDRGRPDDVDEQNGNLLELLLWQRSRQTGQLSLQWLERDVDNGIAQYLALGLECGDGRGQLGASVNHGSRLSFASVSIQVLLLSGNATLLHQPL